MKNNKDNKNTGDLLNPFSPKYPVDPRYFANRDVILTDFVRFLKISASRSPPRPENIAILGNWGIGKTSILRKDKNLLIKEGRGKYRIYHPLFREYLRKNGEE